MATRHVISNNTGVTIKDPGRADLMAALRILAQREVLVGFPEDTTGRDSIAGLPTTITNASLAYIHDNGAPEANIPARPFMIPAITSIEGRVESALSSGMRDVLKGGGRARAEAALTVVGLIGKLAIQTKINEGIPPPLSERTLRERASRGRKGAAQELENRGKGLGPSTDLAKPLIDTAQMRNAANYVIRDRARRR